MWVSVAVVAAACGGQGSDLERDEIGDGDVRTSTTADESAGADGPRTTTGDAANRDVGGRTGTTRSATKEGVTPAGRPAPAPGSDDAVIAGAAKAGPGGFARVLLQPQPAPRLVLEVQQQLGADYYGPGIDRLVTTLGSVSGKPVSRPGVVRIESADQSHTAAEIRGLADEFGRASQGGGQAVLRILYLRGRYAESGSVLGVAVRGDVVAIFPDVIDSAATPVVPPSAIEDAVVMHEAGHSLGLVDLVIDTGRADPDHPGHSPNRDSVMYWAVESDVVAHLLGGPPPREFDAADKRDLATIRNGG